MSSTGDVWIKVRFRRFRLISIDTHLWSECDKQVRNGGGVTRSSRSQWSPTGLNDPVSDPVEGRPEAGAPQADGAHGAVGDGQLGKLMLAHVFELIDGEDLTVDIKRAVLPVASQESERLERRVTGEGLVGDPNPELTLEFPGAQTPGEKIGDGNHVIGGHDGPSLLASWSAACACISDAHETRSRLLSKIIIFASQDLISCLPACQSALSDKDLLDLSMKADIYITYGRACQ